MLKKIADFYSLVKNFWLNRRFSARSNRWLRFYVRLGDGYIWVLFSLFLFWKVGWDNFLPILWHALTALAVSLVAYWVIKLCVKRARPFDTNPSIEAGAPPLHTYRFPSGHTMNNLAVASAVFFSAPQYGWVMVLLPLTWGLLRVYFGVHWLTDVLCGFLFGVLSFVIGHCIWILIF